ncbi:MAG: N-6 DNA methylase [Thermoguttaceae bacterium]|jgi:type I restriction-modification system DNA methylase subunit|nr:N-6 DNA methylase [Thermoguttaceae bacterium]
MSTDTQNIVNKAWNFANVLRDDGLSYMAYTEQITFLLFLKMADELTRPPYKRASIVPRGLDWPSLLAKDGDELEVHYRHVLEELGKKGGMLGEIFRKAKPEIQNPALLRRLICELIGREQWTRMEADVKAENKQLNFLQHVRTLLKVNGRCAIVVPDNVLFEGGAGETVRRNLMQQCDVHTLLRLPTGIFYAQGVKANVLFFDARPAQEKPWTRKLWVYDLRTNMHFTLKQNPLVRADLDEFVGCYRPANRHRRKPTFSEKNPEGRWRVFDYDELIRRDKVNLDLFWLRDKTLDDGDDLPEPDVIAEEIADDLQTALDQFRSIAEGLRG